MKKLLILSVLALASLGAALKPSEARAQGVQYYFVSACAVGGGFYCPSGPNPLWFGPYSSLAACDTAWALWSQGPLGQYPRSLSSCFHY